MNDTYDIGIIGGGVIGTNLSIELKSRYPQNRIAVFEKENFSGYHSSGRNSGVLHAGFYYTADSFKAKFTAQGNLALRDYCKVKRLKMVSCGKLVVAKNEEELRQFPILLNRARANSVELNEITFEEAKKIEPKVKTHKMALWSPNTATVDPLEVMNSLVNEAKRMKIDFHFNTTYNSHIGDTVYTNRGKFKVGFIINAAGLYSDKIARDFGFSKNYRILPFKGIYLYSNETVNPLKTHIYPVPNLKNPFLGVHHTQWPCIASLHPDTFRQIAFLWYYYFLHSLLNMLQCSSIYSTVASVCCIDVNRKEMGCFIIL
jgi:L-2-hydroxyglutarate oxidase LhgO